MVIISVYDTRGEVISFSDTIFNVFLIGGVLEIWVEEIVVRVLLKTVINSFLGLESFLCICSKNYYILLKGRMFLFKR